MDNENKNNEIKELKAVKLVENEGPEYDIIEDAIIYELRKTRKAITKRLDQQNADIGEIKDLLTILCEFFMTDGRGDEELDE